jgi:hypothetical protein
MSFDDPGDGFSSPFKKGQLSEFKKKLKEHADKNGLTEEGKRRWREGNRPSARPKPA